MLTGEKLTGGIKRVDGKGIILVNDDVYIVKGKILDNPFVRKIENSEAVFWILNNQDRVNAHIKRRFWDYGVIGGDVDDCFNMMVNEFNTRIDLQFNKNYFGEDTGYTVEEYVLNRVKHMVYKYKNKLAKEESVPLLTTDEVESFKYGVAEEVVTGDITVEDIIEQDLDYWDDLFYDLVDKFLEFLQSKLYKELDYELVMTHLYFNVGGKGNDVDQQKHYERVAELSGETVDVIVTIVEDMVLAVKEGDLLGTDILRIIQELLEGKKYGWRPFILRKEKSL